MNKNVQILPPHCSKKTFSFIYYYVPKAASSHRPGGIHMSEYSIKIWEHIFWWKECAGKDCL